ncbi:MAG TPA: FxSxx-COOH system tetratricopeptide repeat protein [Symbiobacteriaceae bacterium]|jgi:tetratricopeptide (TPR) repeat protein
MDPGTIDLLKQFVLGVAVNQVSDRIVNPLVDRFAAGKQLKDPGLEQAAHLAFIQAQEAICEECLVLASTPDELFRLKVKQKALAEERETLIKSTRAPRDKAKLKPPLDDAADVALLITPHRPDIQAAHNDLAGRLVAVATGAPDTPELYAKRLAERLYLEMGRCFGLQLKQHPDLQRAFDTSAITLVLATAFSIKVDTETIKETVATIAKQVDGIYNNAFPPPPSGFKAVPVARSASFVGRKRLLERIRSLLTENETVALYGLGGVGKTQAAARYAYDHWDDYRFIFWLRAEEESTLGGDYAGLAKPLGVLVAGLPNADAVVEAVRRTLEQTEDWLLVFDNARGRDSLQPYLPRTPKGHVLITSRDSRWGGKVKHLEIVPFEPAESTAFLTERTGREEPEAAALLAAALGHLPLALAQAGAYIAERPLMTISGYLKLYLERRQKLLNDVATDDEYKQTVGTTWDISFEAVQQEAPAAADLLRLSAALAPDQIPVHLLARGADKMPEPLAAAMRDDEQRHEVVAAACRYSLMQANPTDGTLSIHRLVQEVIRDRLGDVGGQRWVDVAAAVLTKVFPGDVGNLDQWPVCKLLLPHAESVLEQIYPRELDSAATGYLRDQLGTYLWRVGGYPRALAHLERGLAIDERGLGPKHENTAASHNNLGNLLSAMGRYEEALGHLQKALDICRRILGPDNPDTASSHNNLGTILDNMGRHEEALDHLKQALDIRQRVLPPDHPQIATAHNNLAALLYHMKRYEEALARHRQALDIRQRGLPPDHPDTAITHSNLGSVLDDMGRNEEGLAHHQQALDIMQRVLPPVHPDLALAHYNLAAALDDMGRYEEGLAHHQQALDIRQCILPLDHPDIATSHNNLGAALYDMGRYEEGLTHHQQALDIRQRILPLDHPDIATAHNNLGTALGAMDRYDEALAHLQQALGIRQRVLPADHPDTAQSHTNLGAVLYAMERYEEALTHQRQAVNIRERTLPPRHPHLAEGHENLAIILQAMGRYEEAEQHFRRAREIRGEPGPA